MRNIAAVFAIFAMLALGSAAAPASLATPSDANATDENVTLQQGETVTLEIDPSLPSGARVIARGPAPPPDELDQFSMRANLSGATSAWTGNNYGSFPAPNGARVPAPTPNIVTVTFIQIPNSDHVMLFLRNGYAQLLNYRAYIYRPGSAEPTDVCQVAPGHRGYEHWPYTIDRIVLSGFSLSDWSEGQRLECR
jgi:hypothetical protein